MSAGLSQPDTGYVQGPMGVLEDFRLRKLPTWAVYIAIVSVIASWIPLAIIYRAYYGTSTKPRIHYFQDMDNQPKFRPQSTNAMFADGRAMRPAIAGTVARGAVINDDHFNFGFAMGSAQGQPQVRFLKGYPAAVQAKLDDPQSARALLLRGQNRYNIYCATCHGADGMGAGATHLRAYELTLNGVQGMAWVQPKSLHDPTVLVRDEGHLFNTITNGIRNMGGYASQIDPADRWAIVAYVRTLQFAQAAKADAVPAEKRDALK